MRAVPEFDHIVRMTGQIIRRKVSNVGIHYEGHLFSDPEKLEALRKKGGLDREFVIRVDPYNYGEIWLLDDIDGEWITLPNANPEVSVGVSRFQYKLMNRRARELAGQRGAKAVTDDDRLEARQQLEAEADAALAAGGTTGKSGRAMRFHTNGEFFSPLYGGAFGSLVRSEAPAAAAAGATTQDPTGAPDGRTPASVEERPADASDGDGCAGTEAEGDAAPETPSVPAPAIASQRGAPGAGPNEKASWAELMSDADAEEW